MTNTIRMTSPRAGDNVLAASRQAWLAMLGAASVTREWAGREVVPALRSLAAEGANVESKLLRRVGRRLQANVSRGSAILRHARLGLESSAQKVADAAASLARRTLPRVRVAVTADTGAISARAPRAKASAKPAKRAARTRKVAKGTVAGKRRAARHVTAK
ncbi:MAG: hypothetical protein KGJ25_05635 [Betaproteobacteria bacterium]|nr:hypothetical protein [Betaproteobacteria bacterium]